MAGAAEAADEAGGRALGPTSTSQSSGAVRSPILLLSGLGLVLTGGVALTMRARRRPGA